MIIKSKLVNIIETSVVLEFLCIRILMASPETLISILLYIISHFGSFNFYFKTSKTKLQGLVNQFISANLRNRTCGEPSMKKKRNADAVRNKSRL